MAKKAKQNSRRKIKKTALFRRAAELPQALLDNAAHITLIGNRQLNVDGCYGILCYSEELIKLSTGNLLLTLCGSGLYIETYSDKELSIHGKIMRLEYS